MLDCEKYNCGEEALKNILRDAALKLLIQQKTHRKENYMTMKRIKTGCLLVHLKQNIQTIFIQGLYLLKLFRLGIQRTEI